MAGCRLRSAPRSMSFNETPEEFVRKWTERGAKDAFTAKDRVKANKKELLAYYKKHRRRVPVTHPLKYRESKYFSLNSLSRDPVFIRAATQFVGKELTSLLVMKRKKTELLAYYKIHRRKVPRGHPLAFCESNYFFGRLSDPTFVRAARRFIGPPTQERVRNNKIALLQYYRKHGRLVPSKHPLKNGEVSYLYSCSQSYDAAFARAARKLLKARQ